MKDIKGALDKEIAYLTDLNVIKFKEFKPKESNDQAEDITR